MPKCSNPSYYGRCRKCDACLQTRLRSWLLRMMLEAMLYDSDRVTFLTLTYNDKNLPGDEKLSKESVQKFFKRLRKLFDVKIRYVAALERGTQFTMRYHWHAIIYGIRFTSTNRHFIEKAWGNGFIHWKPSTPGRMSYVLKYVIKGGKFLMSRRPGIGDGMIFSLNKTLASLSKEELDKLALSRDMSYVINKFVIKNKFDPLTGTYSDREEIKIATGRDFHQKAKTLQSLRVGGFYYPLHDFIKKRIINLRLKHEKESKK